MDGKTMINLCGFFGGGELYHHLPTILFWAISRWLQCGYNVEYVINKFDGKPWPSPVHRFTAGSRTDFIGFDPQIGKQPLLSYEIYLHVWCFCFIFMLVFARVSSPWTMVVDSVWPSVGIQKVLTTLLMAWGGLRYTTEHMISGNWVMFWEPRMVIQETGWCWTNKLVDVIKKMGDVIQVKFIVGDV